MKMIRKRILLLRRGSFIKITQKNHQLKPLIIMENQMFCFQCQETAKGTGCTVVGVCGKQPATAAMMDMLLFSVRGVAVVATALRDMQEEIPQTVAPFVSDALFSTITNANFDEEAIRAKVEKGFVLRNHLLTQAIEARINVPQVEEVTWFGRPDAYMGKAPLVGVLRHSDPDDRSLRELIVYGLKGMAAYLEHARNLGYADGRIDAFIQRALSDITVKNLNTEELVCLVMKTGRYGLEAMELLDKANTSTYGDPEITTVETGVRNRPSILISGHDLRDLEMLLEQTKDANVDVYTHGEMLPAHYYPFFKRFPNLVGNYGSSWWHQRDDFASFNGPILFTTNCIVPPLADAVYRNRIFTTNSTGYPNCPHIEADEKGQKDFSAIIALAKKLASPTALEKGKIVGGFAHGQVMKLADKLVEAIKKGDIRKLVVMAGCDGRMKSREYYTEYARQLPHDCVILTAGCAKYRYNKLALGDIGGIPRVLDAGQCNDSYSWIRVAKSLQEVFGLKDINDLPIVYNIAWHEQKAVIVLLALLASGVKDIHLGPTLPGFLSPAVLSVLVRRFGIGTISTVEEDRTKMVA